MGTEKNVPSRHPSIPPFLSRFIFAKIILWRFGVAGALWSKRARSIAFSKDLSQGFFDARTVAYVALQLAYHLGFDKVILVGVDLDQSSGRFYEKPGSVLSPCGLDQHYPTRILPSLKLMGGNSSLSRRLLRLCQSST